MIPLEQQEDVERVLVPAAASLGLRIYAHECYYMWVQHCYDSKVPWYKPSKENAISVLHQWCK